MEHKLSASTSYKIQNELDSSRYSTHMLLSCTCGYSIDYQVLDRLSSIRPTEDMRLHIYDSNNGNNNNMQQQNTIMFNPNGGMNGMGGNGMGGMY